MPGLVKPRPSGRGATTYREEKRASLTELRDTVETLKVAIILGQEIKAVRSLAAFQQAAEAAVSIGRQSEGWLRSVKQPKHRIPTQTNLGTADGQPRQ
jgi:hypothetical protein